MLFFKFFIYDYKQKHNDFIGFYFGHDLEQPCFVCGGSSKIDHLGNSYSAFKERIEQYKEWFVKI